MIEVYAAAEEIQNYFDQRGWPNCIIDAIAVIRWGRERTDADFSLLTGFGSEREFLDDLTGRFPAREPGEVDFAMRARVYRCYASNTTPVDIGLAAFPFEEQIIERARPYTFSTGHVLRVCDVHDLIVMKAFAGREQDWADLLYLVAWHRKTLDWRRIDGPLDELCQMAENFDAVPKLTNLRQRVKELDRKA